MLSLGSRMPSSQHFGFGSRFATSGNFPET